MGIRALRFLVIDEADRMIENGHFAELENIVRLTQRDMGFVPLVHLHSDADALYFTGRLRVPMMMTRYL